MKATRTRTPRTAPPPPPPVAEPVCTCQGGPLLIATWRNEQLVSVVRQHWTGRDHCHMPTENLDPAQFATTG